MIRFNPEDYKKFRPLYPLETFSGLKTFIKTRHEGPLPVIADLGCGTGHSIRSYLNTQLEARVIGVDPDPEMLKAASEFIGDAVHSHVELREGSGEATFLTSESVDAILVGSAFHWMNAEFARSEFKRILKSPGYLLIFEYQFPKSIQFPGLNDWVKRQFNQFWKFSDQTPRGDLREITRIFSEDSDFLVVDYRQPAMILKLNLAELAGFLFSQSRFLHFEKNLSLPDQEKLHPEVIQKLGEWMEPERQYDFDFKLNLIEFNYRKNLEK